MITLDGLTQPIIEWALDYGIYPAVITDRLARGWTVERAITTPMTVAPRQRMDGTHLPGLPKLKRKPRVPSPLPKLQRGRLYQHDGESFTLAQWSEVCGISVDALRSRIRHGMTIDQAIELGRLRSGRFGGWVKTCQPLRGPAGGAPRKTLSK